MMRTTRSLRRGIASALALIMVVTAVPPRSAQAMLAPMDGAAAEAKGDRAEDLAAVRRALENRLVRQRLVDLGLSPAEVNRRVGRLSDAQLHQAALNIEQQHPAGDTGTILLVAAGVVLFVVLIVKLLQAGDDDDDVDVRGDDDLDDDDDDATIQQNAPASAPSSPDSDRGPETIIVK